MPVPGRPRSPENPLRLRGVQQHGATGAGDESPTQGLGIEVFVGPPGLLDDLAADSGVEVRLFTTVIDADAGLDTVNGIVFYFVLLIPFSFFMERLLFGFADIRRQLAAQAEAIAGKRGPKLIAVNKHDGSKLSETELPAPPVFDGMAVANGRLYLSTKIGKVVCIGPDG
mgnify:CR=1 FL=1